MEFYENLHSIANSDEMIIDFTNFCKKVHEQIEYKGEDCELNLFAGWLVDFFGKKKQQDHSRQKTVFYFSL